LGFNIKPTLDISNMDISNSDDEDVRVIYANLDTPSTSTSRINQDIPSTLAPQTINVSPPPTLLLGSIVLKEVCENIFEDLNRLVKARNDAV
jgi:predicted metallo-beta-lactamase superfamily hydrolase